MVEIFVRYMTSHRKRFCIPKDEVAEAGCVLLSGESIFKNEVS
jgi:hypothetical protein